MTGLPNLSSIKPADDRIGGLNNITNLSEIDLSLIKGGNKGKFDTPGNRNDEAEHTRKQLGGKKQKPDQKKNDREDKNKDKEKDKVRKDSLKDDKKRKSNAKSDRKEEITEKPSEEPVK